VRLHSPRDGRRVGIGLIPEDRTAQALFPRSSVRHNLTAASEDRITRTGFIRDGEERRLARETVQRLGIRTPSIEQRVAFLSGGNQQKVVLGRWFIRSPSVLVLDDPTVGVDVGAKEEIYRLIDTMTHDGTGILLISSDLPELLSLADRILVIHAGRIAGSMAGPDASQEAILHLATGGAPA
jgi:L-arabinose transport system ATP-binding protein